MKKYFIIILVLVVSLSVIYYFRDYQHEEEVERADDYIKSLNLDEQNSQNDPLGLFGEPNPELDECLEKVNPSDPLGLYDETENQKIQREECINKYKK
jgi:hypothetical protein